jgi:ABC-type transporter Mla subunit MlaD
MTTKFFRFLRGLYEPVLVLLVVGSAGLLLYAVYHAVGGGHGDSICFEAAFDDVSGIKERSSVLFKGMPVGSVGVMKYDPVTNKILVRIDIKKPRDIPANITPYVESSLMGQSSIALRTENTDAAQQLLADAVSQHQAKSRKTLYRLEGVRLSRAESLMPGFDMRAQKAMTAALEAMVEAQKAMTTASGTMVEMKKLAGNWRELSSALIDGKDKTVSEVQKVVATLDKAGQAVSRSESQFKKLGAASEKLGDASDSVKGFMDMIKMKPNALIWGMSEQQRAVLDQQRARHSKPIGAGNQ